ncbi:MAG: hypothetical protein ACJ780_28660 [Solirubrobacteraceae bacterium]
MSVITVGKNGRVYQRKFDWDEARARHEAGESYPALARAYGVSVNAMMRACDPRHKQRIDARRDDYQSNGVCDVCGKTGITSAAHRRQTNPAADGRVLCAACRSLAKRTRFRYDDQGVLVAICCSILDCAHGERWQPPENFPGGVRYRDVRPKGIHNLCRDCNTRTRRKYRRRNREASNAYDRAQRARRKAAA